MISLPSPHGPGAYMTWLATQPCAYCKRAHGITHHPVHLHHLRMWNLPRRTNNPLRNYTLIALCPRHHTDGTDAVHNVGEREFFERMNTTPDALLLSQFRAYVATRLLPSLPIDITTRAAAEWLLARESTHDPGCLT